MGHKLSFEQIKVVSGIFANLGHIFFAGGVLSSLFPQFVLETADIPSAIMALITALFLWTASVLFVKKPQPLLL